MVCNIAFSYQVNEYFIIISQNSWWNITSYRMLVHKKGFIERWNIRVEIDVKMKLTSDAAWVKGSEASTAPLSVSSGCVPRSGFVSRCAWRAWHCKETPGWTRNCNLIKCSQPNIIGYKKTRLLKCQCCLEGWMKYSAIKWCFMLGSWRGISMRSKKRNWVSYIKLLFSVTGMSRLLYIMLPGWDMT